MNLVAVTEQKPGQEQASEKVRATVAWLIWQLDPATLITILGVVDLREGPTLFGEAIAGMIWRKMALGYGAIEVAIV